MKRVAVVLGAIALVVAGLAAASAMARFERGDVVVRPGTQIVVPPGSGPIAMVDRLVESGDLARDLRWRVWFKLRPFDNCLQAGTHTMPPAATPRELMLALCEPTEAPQFDVTIRPGTNVFSLAEEFAATELAADAGSALLLLQDPALAATLEIPSPSLEGYLWPETVRFEVGTALTAVLERFAREAQERRASIWQDNASSRDALTAAHGLDDHAFITIASIVEREAVVDEERPMIARVIYNRLAAGMPLQMDPTCMYSAEHHDQRPTRAVCRDPNNAYSTYVISALPPTPIAMPGSASLEAALAPADDPDVLYFVTIGDGSGRHAFASTLDEHQANVDRWLGR